MDNDLIDIFKTGTINGAGDSLTVLGTINGNSCEITVDTGSNISIVRPDLLSGVNPDLIQPVHSCIRTVTGERAPIHGKGQVELGIGPLVIPQELWVADIQDQCILGLDFLHPNECQVNLRDQLLTIGKHEIPLKRSSSVSTDQACLKAVLVQEVCLQPLSETVVSVKVDGAQSYTVGMLEQVEIPPHLDGLLVARTLVDLSKGSIPMRVLNLSHQQRIVRKGTQLASCDAVSSIVTFSPPGTWVTCPQSLKHFPQVAELVGEGVSRGKDVIKIHKCNG